MTGQISFKVVMHAVYILFSTSAYILETGGIENVLTVTEAKVEPELTL